MDKHEESTMKILVLEVAEKDKLLTEMLLRNREHNLVILLNPLDVIKMIKNEKFDIIFIPLNIFGIDSLKLCRRIKALNQGCILYSSSTRLRLYDMDCPAEIFSEGLLEGSLKNDIIEATMVEAVFPLFQASDKPGVWN
jgi:CheY-like chemotaxis protein